MKVHVPHCRIGHLYHMDYQGLGNHYFIYIGRYNAENGTHVYHFRMITSCDTPEKKRKLAMYQQRNPARYLTLTNECAKYITHDSYIDVEFTVSLSEEQVRKRLVVPGQMTDKESLREEDFNRLLEKCHLLNTPPAMVRKSGAYKSVHAL